jgi:hypothetical protein
MTANGPIVSIIVVSYNTQEMTLACIRSVIAETQAPYELLVVDNASSDGSAEAIADEFPEITLLAESENHGFAGANNIAAKNARGQYILLLNPDTVVLNSAIDKLVAFAKAKPEAKIWGGRTVFDDGSLNPTCCFQRISLWKLFCRASGIALLFRNHRMVSETYGRWKMDEARPVDIVAGCFLLVPRQLWEALGGFDLAYFMYGEEADLCLRAKAQFGAKPHFTPHAQIVHYGGASEPVRADRRVRLFKSKMRLIEDHLPKWQRPLGRFLLLAVPPGRYLSYSCAALVTGHDGLSRAAHSWAKTWAQRQEWRNGHSE